MRWALPSCLASAAMCVFSFSASGDERALSLEDAYVMALKKNEQVKVADEALYQARLWPKRVYTLVSPRLNFLASYTRQQEIKTEIANLPSSLTGGMPLAIPPVVIQPDYQYQYQITLLWTLYQGTIGPYWRQAHRIAEGAESLSIRTKQEILFQVATAYYSLLKGQAFLTIAREAMDQASSHFKEAQARFKAGQVTKVAVLRARMEQSQAQKRLVDAENNMILARESLFLLIGAEGDYRVIEGTDVTPPAYDSAELASIARDNREDLIKAAKDEEVAREDRNSVKGKFLPTVSVTGNYSYTDPWGSFGTPWNWRVALTLQVPLFQGGTEYLDLKEKNSALEQARLKKTLLEKQAVVDLKKAILDMEAAQKNITILKLERDLARETSGLVEEQFKVGVASSIELTDAHTARVTAEQRLAEGTYAYQLSILSLQMAAGTFARQIVSAHQL